MKKNNFAIVIVLFISILSANQTKCFWFENYSANRAVRDLTFSTVLYFTSRVAKKNKWERLEKALKIASLYSLISFIGSSLTFAHSSSDALMEKCCSPWNESFYIPLARQIIEYTELSARLLKKGFYGLVMPTASTYVLVKFLEPKKTGKKN